MINYYTIDKEATTNEAIYHLTIPGFLNRRLKYDLKLQIVTLTILGHRQAIITLDYIP